MRVRGSLIPLFAILCAPTGVVAGELPVTSVRITELAAADFDGQSVVTVRFRNPRDEADPAAWVVAPVPTGFVVVPGSIRGPGASVRLSTDGPEAFEEDGVETAPDPEQVTHVRWDLHGTLSPGVAGLVSFRVRPATRPPVETDAPDVPDSTGIVAADGPGEALGAEESGEDGSPPEAESSIAFTDQAEGPTAPEEDGPSTAGEGRPARAGDSGAVGSGD